MRRAGRSACYDLRRVFATRQGSCARGQRLQAGVDARGVKRVPGTLAACHWRRSGAATKQPPCDARAPGNLRLPIPAGQTASSPVFGARAVRGYVRAARWHAPGAG